MITALLDINFFMFVIQTPEVSENFCRYLHEVCAPSVVHRNIKSANILLDAEMNPHLSDCGLASFITNLDHVNFSKLSHKLFTLYFS